MKEKVMLIVPMLHQGGFERVCVTTARLLEPYYDVTIVLFNSANIAYDVEGLKLIDLQLGVQKGKLRKLFNMLKRSRRVKKLKKECVEHSWIYQVRKRAEGFESFSSFD